MAKIPQAVLDRQRLLPGLVLKSMGKVRDCYFLPGYPDKMLVVASDRISIFDFVLNALIMFKGMVLSAMNVFWIFEILEGMFKHDLIACGAAIDKYLPPELRNNPELQKRAVVVTIYPQPQMESIIRFNLTGSGWDSYQETGMVCGHRLPKGLINGSELPFPIFTSTTKAEEGHDEHMTADEAAKQYGFDHERLVLKLGAMVRRFALERGIVLADDKTEESRDENGDLVVVDEKFTPDSSRFWDLRDFNKSHAQGKLPKSFDKQYVREWGKKAGIDPKLLDPENEADIAFVHGLGVPQEVCDQTTRLYRYIFWRLTGMKLERFQREKMGIAVDDQLPLVEILIGSKSDVDQIDAGIANLKGHARFRVSVISCHRNTEELRMFTQRELTKADIVIAGAGCSAQLPGIVKSHLCRFGHSEIPVIGVAFAGKSEAENIAAQTAIEEVPGKPLEVDADGHAYFGPLGFLDACIASFTHEFQPKEIVAKPAEIGILDCRAAA